MVCRFVLVANAALIFLTGCSDKEQAASTNASKSQTGEADHHDHEHDHELGHSHSHSHEVDLSSVKEAYVVEATANNPQYLQMAAGVRIIDSVERQ